MLIRAALKQYKWQPLLWNIITFACCLKGHVYRVCSRNVIRMYTRNRKTKRFPSFQMSFFHFISTVTFNLLFLDYNGSSIWSTQYMKLCLGINISQVFKLHKYISGNYRMWTLRFGSVPGKFKLHILYFREVGNYRFNFVGECFLVTFQNFTS